MRYIICILIALSTLSFAAPDFPAVRAVPMPGDEISFEVNGVERLRYCRNDAVGKPHLFPLIGPAGKRVTRMGHPDDPHGHRHHKGIWITHMDVGGVDFWVDDIARIEQEKIEKIIDGKDSATLIVLLRWNNPEGKTLLHERRTITLHALENNESYVDITCAFTPEAEEIVLGETPFGFIGTRVAKTMGVKDGGGVIRNSEGQVNEKDVFRKPARWVDYSGRVTPDIENGITLMDHPENPGHPTPFHVRNDGWMGACFTFRGAYTLRKTKPLTLKYRLYAHGPEMSLETLNTHWNKFAESVK